MLNSYQIYATVWISKLASERYQEEMALLKRRGALAIEVLLCLMLSRLVKVKVTRNTVKIGQFDGGIPRHVPLPGLTSWRCFESIYNDHRKAIALILLGYKRLF
jgi:hypothetical protein